MMIFVIKTYINYCISSPTPESLKLTPLVFCPGLALSDASWKQLSLLQPASAGQLLTVTASHYQAIPILILARYTAASIPCGTLDTLHYMPLLNILMFLSKHLYWTCDKFSLLQTPGPWLDNTIYISHQNPREAHSSSVEWQQHSSDTDTRQSPGPRVTIITELWRANIGLRTSWSTHSVCLYSVESSSVYLLTGPKPELQCQCSTFLPAS